MRKLKGSGSYLKGQTRKNLAKAILSLTFFILTLLATGYLVILTRDIGVLQITIFIVSMIPLGAFLFYQRKYQIYRSGSRGEQNVIGTLNRSLSDDYYIVNEVYLGKGGDIDHIVLGPTGIFVLETKNWSGKIFGDGDKWQRPGKKSMGSPSLQVKRNTQKVKRLIDASPALRSLNVWVEGIVVFTNPNAHISLSSPTVTILKLQQLSKHIKNQKSVQLTPEQIQQVGKQIQNA